MTKLRNFSGAFLVIWLISTLFTTVWLGFQDAYDIIPTADQGGISVIEKISNINFMSGITKLVESIYRITAPSNVFDLLGALGSAGAGVLQTVGGIITFPADIFSVISGFYPGGVPAPFTTFLGAIIIVYVGFLILSAYTRVDL